MSANLQQGTDVGIASLPLEQEYVDIDAEKSKCHYIWNPFVNIRLSGPEGLRMRLGAGWTYYGMARPGETQFDYEQRRGNMLLRCNAYPLKNIYYKETKVNQGNFTEQEQRAGNSPTGKIALVDRMEYAGVCAADFLGRYEADYGARILKPFLGMEGPEADVVDEILRLVQPRAWKLTNLAQENAGTLTDEQTLLFDLQNNGPAYDRIQSARLDTKDRLMAETTRRIMLSGVRAAIVTAKRDYADLILQLGNSKMGQTHNKKQANEYDREVAMLLGEPVPAAVVAVPQGDAELKQVVMQLAENQMRQQTPIQLPPQIDPQMIQDLIEKEVAKRLAAMSKKGKPAGQPEGGS